MTKLIEKANIELSHNRGTVERNIHEYEEKAVFKHKGSWNFCKKVDGVWKEYEILINPYTKLKPKM